MRESLCQTLLLSGGSCKFEGFKKRLLKELTPLAPPAAEFRVIQDESGSL
jgi:actin-related protein